MSWFKRHVRLLVAAYNRWSEDEGSAMAAAVAYYVALSFFPLLLTLIAVPLSRLTPRQGRYARIGVAALTYFFYSNLLSAAKVWVEKGILPPAIGVWWVHLIALALGLYLLQRGSPRSRWYSAAARTA